MKNRLGLVYHCRRGDDDADKGNLGTISGIRSNGICNCVIRSTLTRGGIPQEVVQLDSIAVGQRGFKRLNEPAVN